MEATKESGRSRKILPVVTVILAVALTVMVVLYILQLLFIMELVKTAVDLVEAEVLREIPDGVDPAEVRATFERVREAVPKRKVNFGKARHAATYAQRARNGGWTADEVETLLDMMNTALGGQKERN